MSITAYMGKPGEGMQCRNRATWMSVADFLARQNLRQVLKARERAEAAGVAGAASAESAARGASQTLPLVITGRSFYRRSSMTRPSLVLDGNEMASFAG